MTTVYRGMGYLSLSLNIVPQLTYTYYIAMEATGTTLPLRLALAAKQTLVPYCVCDVPLPGST